ncbi:protein phosphatase 2C 70 isoform X2 [Nymphaea colorata]|uniref:protein phosphatase 2C 70 isoform X2 n=1 Tax=Nymphaea colorata TaxID=210225 RepID=UPI00129DF028|nr:protein phosphatase 2C 70 isoform X2 [Nymphaea colorata]
MALPLAESLIAVVLLLLSLLFILFLFFCKPWRFFSSRAAKVTDLEKPLIPDVLDFPQSQSSSSARNHGSEVPSTHVEENFTAHRQQGHFGKQMPSSEAGLDPGGSLTLDVLYNPPDGLQFGQTIKHTNWSAEKRKLIIKGEASLGSDDKCRDQKDQSASMKDVTVLRSGITLEVISGPSRGLRCSLQSSDSSKLPLTIGRVPPSDLLLGDSEVSGKHARINWNSSKSKWELLDMGSLNGTLLNSLAVNLPDSESRHWSEPVGLANGDVITFGMASDPMSMRRGGKKLPMEDISYCEWPLPGIEQFGLFAIFDGHGGSGASNAACKLLPKTVASILAVPETREYILSHHDASEVLRDAFYQTEAAMSHEYEGCCATVLLVWSDLHEGFFAQCANVGDSACILNIDGRQNLMTEDHRLTSESERTRLTKMGGPLRDGETRLCGLNIARMLGDKFLKEQDLRFSSLPHISQVLHITRTSKAFALLASDGLWDVLSIKKANQLILQYRETYDVADQENIAELIAKLVLNEARTLRTKDNTSVIYLDFSTNRTSCCRI